MTTKAKIEYRKGDLFAALDEFIEATAHDMPGFHPGMVCVPHVCNDQGAWGAGFVMGLSKWWDEPEKQYKRWHENQVHKSQGFEKGGVQVIENDNGVYIANMIAQGLGGVKPLSYAALGACMYGVTKRMGDYYFKGEHDLCDLDVDYSYRIFCPKFGSGLAGGSWPHIEEMIQESWVDQFGIDVVVFTL